MSESFLEAVRARRSNYTIKKSSPIPDGKIIEIVTESAKHSPSSLNLMPGRTVLLLGPEHDKFWSIVDEVNQGRMSPADYEGTKQRIAGFAGGYGTVLFFIDQTTVNDLVARHPKIAIKAQQFGEHTSAMNQYITWTALTLEGFGCSLQHYNPFVDPKVLATWNLPGSWILTAQLVFGERADSPKEKIFKPMEDKVKTFK